MHEHMQVVVLISVWLLPGQSTHPVSRAYGALPLYAFVYMMYCSVEYAGQNLDFSAVSAAAAVPRSPESGEAEEGEV